MLSMPDIDAIRSMDREGASVAEISRATGHDPKTVRKYVDMDDFSPEPLERRSRPSILDPYKRGRPRVLRVRKVTRSMSARAAERGTQQL